MYLSQCWSYPKTDESTRAFMFHLFLAPVFGTRDEALALVFDKLHETEQSSTSNTIDLEQRFQANI